MSDKYDEVTRILRGSGNKGERVTDNCGRKKAAGSFLKCLRSNKPVRLERWLDKYEKSILPGIRTFVRGIRMDITAVRNAMIYPVSNGITEGFVNKLKTIKRVMYGKAKLPLVKIKMVMTTCIFN